MAAGIDPSASTPNLGEPSNLSDELRPEADEREENRTSSFSQIRQRFEKNSRAGVEQKAQLSLLSINPPESQESLKCPTDFHRLYPRYKDYFTKRQFAATEQCFHEADKNGDGFLESKEIKQMLVDHNHQVNLCDADYIVNLGDQDEDGKLSPKEFLELCKTAAEGLKQQHHMEGSFPISDKEFIGAIMGKFRSFVSPVSTKVKGTRQFFENMISNGARVVAVKDKELLLRRPLKRNTVLQEALRTNDK